MNFKKQLDKNFIGRIIKTSIWLGVFLTLFCFAYQPYLPKGFALSFFVGAVVSVGNLIALKGVIENLVKVDGIHRKKVISFFVILLVIITSFLYLAKTQKMNPIGLVVGFSITLIVMFLKAVGNVITAKLKN